MQSVLQAQFLAKNVSLNFVSDFVNSELGENSVSTTTLEASPPESIHLVTSSQTGLYQI